MKTVLIFLLLVNPSVYFSAGKPDSNFVKDRANQKVIATKIVKALEKEDYNEVFTTFHTSLKTALPKEKLAESWEAIVTQYGAFESIMNFQETRIGEFDQIKVRCKFKNDNITLDLNYNQDDKVIGIFFRP